VSSYLVLRRARHAARLSSSLRSPRKRQSSQRQPDCSNCFIQPRCFEGQVRGVSQSWPEDSSPPTGRIPLRKFSFIQNSSLAFTRRTPHLRIFDFESGPSARMMCLSRRHNAFTKLLKKLSLSTSGSCRSAAELLPLVAYFARDLVWAFRFSRTGHYGKRKLAAGRDQRLGGSAGRR
jgi:hypothetical protein